MPEETQDVELLEDDSVLDAEEEPEVSAESVSNTEEVEIEPLEKTPQIKKKGGQQRPLPSPPRFKLTLEELANYQEMLRLRRQLQYTRIYVYGLWPVRDVLLPLPKAEQDRIRKLWASKKRADGAPLKSYPAEKTEEPFDRSNPMQDVMHRFGCGDFNFQMKDVRPGFQKMVCMCTVSTPRDFDEYPPDIKPEEVVLTDPKNTSYIHWARNHGIAFPGDPNWKKKDVEEGEDDVAQVKMLTGFAESAMRENRELNKELRNSGAKNGGDSELLKTLMNNQTTMFQTMMTNQADGYKTQIDILNKRLESAEKKAENTGAPVRQTTQDVIEMAKLLVPRKEEEKKSATEDPVFKLLMANLESERERARQDRELAEKRSSEERQMHREQMTAMNTRIDALANENRQLLLKLASPDNSSEARGLNGLRSTIGMVKELAEAVGVGGSGETTLLDVAQDVVPKLLDTVQSGFAAYTAGTQVAASQQRSQSPPVVHNPPPGVPAPQVQQPQNEEQQMRLMMMQAAAFIHKPLVIALQNNRPGHEFAASLLQQYGQQFDMIYTQLLPKGKDGILGEGGMLRLNAELFGELLKEGANGKLERFVEEFLDVQKVRAILAASAQHPPTQTTAPPQTAPSPEATTHQPSNVTPMPPNPSVGGPGQGGGPRVRPPAA